MRVYISGPMSGLPDLNYPAFFEAEASLLRLGYDVENPASNPEPACKSWRGYMRLALVQLAKSDAVVVLDGWRKSRGARLEVLIARALEMEVFDTAELVECCNNLEI